MTVSAPRPAFKSEPYLIVDVAMGKLLGVEKAIILRKIYGWLQHNIEKDINLRDGRHWCYRSVSAWEIDIGVMSRSRIHRHIKSMVDDGWLLTGKYNANRYDKTLWYTIDWVKFFGAFPHMGSVEETIPDQDNPIPNRDGSIPKWDGSIPNRDDDTNKHKTNNINETPKTNITPLPGRQAEAKTKPKIAPEDRAVAQRWLAYAKTTVRKPYASWTEENFAIEAARVVRVSGYTHRELMDVLTFIQSHNIWRPNCGSIKAMTDKLKNGQRKIDCIYNQMKGGNNGPVKAQAKGTEYKWAPNDDWSGVDVRDYDPSLDGG